MGCSGSVQIDKDETETTEGAATPAPAANAEPATAAANDALVSNLDRLRSGMDLVKEKKARAMFKDFRRGSVMSLQPVLKAAGDDTLLAMAEGPKTMSEKDLRESE